MTWKTMVAAAGLAVCGCAEVGRQPPHAYALVGTAPELYERYLVPPLFAPWAEDLIARTGLDSGERVLDVACGTGIVARRAAARLGPGAAVHGLDLNAIMLEVARESSGEGPPPVWEQGDAQRLPYAEASFDVVFCQQGLQFFSDRAQAVREMHRVLAPNGRVAVSVWRGLPANPYGAAIVAALRRSGEDAAAAETSSPFAAAVGDQLAGLFERAGFRDVRSETVTLASHVDDLERLVRADLAAYPHTGALLADWSAPRRDALVASVLAALARFRTGAGWSIPFASQVVVARR